MYMPRSQAPEASYLQLLQSGAVKSPVPRDPIPDRPETRLKHAHTDSRVCTPTRSETAPEAPKNADKQKRRKERLPLQHKAAQYFSGPRKVAKATGRGFETLALAGSVSSGDSSRPPRSIELFRSCRLQGLDEG